MINKLRCAFGLARVRTSEVRISEGVGVGDGPAGPVLAGPRFHFNEFIIMVLSRMTKVSKRFYVLHPQSTHVIRKKGIAYTCRYINVDLRPNRTLILIISGCV